MPKLFTKDILIVIITKILRMFAFGAISIIFIEALLTIRMFEIQIGLLQFCVTLGDLLVSTLLIIKTRQLGVKKTLIASGILKAFVGIIYTLFQNHILLVISGVLGVLTVSGGECGPFMAIEKIAINQIIEERARTDV